MKFEEVIKPTPILFGEDARIFEEEIANPKPASKEEIEAAKRVYEIVKATGKFPHFVKENGHWRFDFVPLKVTTIIRLRAPTAT
ncbi:MAG: hypothetical protein LUB83_04650 [Prevotellaceae bacterium]|nr:hypothetical protein [Prevotellaceae bacterium]